MSESVENRYFYLKLYRGNALAKYWLNKGEHGHNICNSNGHPAAAIYFGDINLEQIKDYSLGNKKEYLFSIDVALEDELDKGNISEELKGKFRDNEYSLSDDAKVTKKGRGITTTGKYGKEKIIIEKENEKLNIYKRRSCQSWNQLKDFVENAKPENRDKIYNLIYLPNEIYITKAVSEVYEVKPYGSKYAEYTQQVKKYNVKTGEDILKVSLQEVLKKRDRWDLPSLVSTLPCDHFLRTGTYREISDKETKEILSTVISGEKLNIKDLQKKEDKDILNYLGIYELETLLFLILYHNKCRPSSWRGGTVEKVDIVGHPSQPKVTIAGKDFSKDTLKFQVKRKGNKQEFKKEVYYVCIKKEGDWDEDKDPFYLGEGLVMGCSTRIKG